jgi:hypothetical protein
MIDLFTNISVSIYGFEELGYVFLFNLILFFLGLL